MIPFGEQYSCDISNPALQSSLCLAMSATAEAAASAGERPPAKAPAKAKAPPACLREEVDAAAEAADAAAAADAAPAAQSPSKTNKVGVGFLEREGADVHPVGSSQPKAADVHLPLPPPPKAYVDPLVEGMRRADEKKEQLRAEAARGIQ